MEKTLFTHTLGSTPKLKVLEFLIEGRELDYSISDIAEGSGIGRTTLFRIWQDLISLDMVKQTRTIGNAKLFRLNMKNPVVAELVKLFDLIIVEPLKEKQTIPIKAKQKN